ncbi:MAG TPA: hypothetical protein DD435_13390 [Cyanobacteria bacterium UBA8530]|nr:hypothetical protein [Cyanobacteria bacterium UBA8530]
MKKDHQKIWLGAAMAAGLLGCQANPVTIPQRQAELVEKTVALPPVSAGNLPQIDLLSKSGQVSLSIKWPERTIQAIPTSANAVRIKIFSEQGELVNDVIGREEGASVTRSYNLKKGVTYSVEAKAYRESSNAVKADTTDALTAIAFTQNAAVVSVNQDETKPLSITLTPLYQPILTPAAYAAGAGAQIQINGDGFGTNPAEIVAYCTNVADPPNAQTWERTNLEIATMSNSVITATVPVGAWDGKVVVKRDGVVATNSGTNQVLFALVNSVSLHPDLALLKYSNSTAKYYAPKDVPFTLPVDAQTNAIGITSDFVKSVSVKNANNQDVTGAVYSNGQFTLPSEGKYSIKYSSGNANASLDVYGATLNWSAFAPEPLLTAVPYYISNALNYNWNSNSGLLPLIDYTLTSGADTVYLEGTDFNWTYSPSGVVALDANYGYQSNKVRFKGGQAAGTSQVTGTLKYDQSKAFVSAFENVKVSSLDVMSDTNKGVWPENLVSLPEGGLTLSVGQTVRFKLATLSLTDGNSLTPDWTFNQGLVWSSKKLDGSSGSAVVGVVPENDVGFALITAKVAGTVEIQLRYTSETDVTKIRKIPVTVQ